MRSTFDPWTASESEARAVTLRMGFPPLHVDLVQGPASRLAMYLLPREAPLRRWCAADQVRELLEKGVAGVEQGRLQHAIALCLLHDLVPPWQLSLALAGHVAAAPFGKGDKQIECLRDRRLQRASWVLMRRYRWAHGAKAPRYVLEQAIMNSGALAEDGDFEPALTDAIKKLGVGKTTFQDAVKKAESLFGPPTWPWSAPHVPPPLE